MPASTFAEILKFNPYHDARGRFTTASGGSAISSVEGEIRTQDYETLAAYGKDGNLLFRKDGNKAEVTLTAEDKQQLRGTIVTHNHPDGNRFSDDDLATFVSTGMDEMRVVTSDGMTCSIKRVDGEQQNGRDLFMDYYKLPITHESQLEEFYLKRIDRDGYSIDDEVVSSDAYYEKVRREFSANWLMENASKYGYTYSEETSTTVGKTFDYILKFNPYHDAKGRFSSADGATLFTYAPGKSTAHDKAISRAKEAAKGFKGTLYHGSPATDIEEFDMSRAGQNTSSGEKLLYFTDSKQLAEDFSYERLEGSTKYMQRRGKKGRVYEVDVEMKNPLDLRNLSDKDVDNILKLDVEGILTREVVQELLVNHQLLKTSLDLRAESLKKLGYDGLIANTGKAGHNSIEYAVVDSKQAKIRKSIAKAFIDILKGNPWHDPTNGRFTSGPAGGSAWSASLQAEKEKVLSMETNEQALYVWEHDGETEDNCIEAMNNGQTEALVNNYFAIMEANGDPTPTNPTSDQLDRQLQSDVRSGKYPGYTEARTDYIKSMSGLDDAEASAVLKEMEKWFGGDWSNADTATIDKYIEKDHVYEGKIHRGMKFDHEGFDSFMQNIAPGAEIGMKRNSSWSSDEDVARLFGAHVHDDIDTVMITCVKNKTSAPVAHLSFQGEAEVLAHSQARWTVLHSEVITRPSGARKAYITVVEKEG